MMEWIFVGLGTALGTLMGCCFYLVMYYFLIPGDNVVRYWAHRR